MNKTLFLCGLAGVLAVVGCSSPDTSTPDAGKPDGGVGGDSADAGQGGAPPDTKHTLTTRPLLGTSAENLLLDPLATTDNSLEHFIGLVFVNGAVRYEYKAPRSIQSQAPVGVALPVAAIGLPAAAHSGAARIQIIAPIPGSSAPLDASLWASAGDANNASAAFSDAAADLVVSLLPNDQPSKSYPLTPMGEPTALGGRSWVKLALPASVSMPEGGWLSISTTSTKWTYEVQAPEVIRSTKTVAPSPPPPPVVVERDPRDTAALSAYVEIAHRHRSPR